MNVPWRIEDGLVLAKLPCSHEVIVRPEWLREGGRFEGRCGCNDATGCRRVFEGVVLEGWRA